MTFIDIGYNEFLDRSTGINTQPHLSAYTFDSLLENGAIESSQLGKYIINDKHLQEEIISNANIKYIPRAYNAIVDLEGRGTHGNIQSAIDYVNTLGGGTILITSGIYKMYDDVNFYSNVHLIGEDKYNTVFDFGNKDYQFKIISKTNCSIKNLQFRNRSGSDSGVILLDSITGINIIDNYFSDNLIGYDIDMQNSLLDNSNVFIQKNIGNNGSTFININSSELVIITENRITNYSKRFLSFVAILATITNNYGENINTDIIYSDDPFTGIISNNFFIDIGGNGFNIGAFENAIIESNWITGSISNSSGIGIILNTGSVDSIFSNNEIDNMGSDGIKLVSSDKNILNANHVEDCGGYGINISNVGSDNNIVTSNLLRNNTSGGINDAGTSDTVANNITV